MTIVAPFSPKSEPDAQCDFDKISLAKKMRCAECNGWMHRSRSSRPEGEAVCLACRSAKKQRCGNLSAYGAGCRCRLCKDAKNASMREYNAHVRKRDGVSATSQYKRKRRGLDPLAEQTYPPCVVCGESLILPSRGAIPAHKACRDVAPAWLKEGREDPSIERARRREERSRRVAELKARDMRSDIRAGYEDGDFERFMRGIQQRTRVNESGCMEWQGKLKGNYATVRIAGKSLSVHRMSLEMKEGKPLGVLAAHHICANSACVNPDHLQAVTDRENVAEMLARTSLEARIDELENVLRGIDPAHPVLNRISHKRTN